MPVMRWFAEYFHKVWDYLVPPEKDAVHADGVAAYQKPEALRAVDQARRDWETARVYFDNVTDPELVDHAIYAIQAAERKYMYLLRRAEDLGFHIEGSMSSPLEQADVKA